ncbi:MAG TPA: hypothetical protein VGO54_07270, partial [Bradyrhizobium sp.]|nr:hypothetical protein [Bradyrhizobium sp.]
MVVRNRNKTKKRQSLQLFGRYFDFIAARGAGKVARNEVRDLGMQDHLAHRLAAGQHLQGVGGLRQR